jgi:hypothetical protein
LKKDQDSETWIIEFEELWVILETVESSILENQFVHIWNSLTLNFKLLLTKMEARVGNPERPLTIEEIRGEITLCIERLDTRSVRCIKGNLLKEQALFIGQFHEECCNYRQLGHKLFQCKKMPSMYQGKDKQYSCKLKENVIFTEV